MEWKEIRRKKTLLRQFMAQAIPISRFTGPSKKLICPFHPDSRPSAKIYPDDGEGERLFCFSCRKQYTSYHYVETVLQENPLLWLESNFSQEELEASLKNVVFGEPRRKPKVPVADILAEHCWKEPLGVTLKRLYEFEHGARCCGAGGDLRSRI